MGWRCSSRFRAPATQSPPKMKNRTRYMLVFARPCRSKALGKFFWNQARRVIVNQTIQREMFGIAIEREMFLSYLRPAQGQPEAGDNDVGDGQGHQVLPTEAHQLVVTEARQRTSHPDIKTEKAEDFQDEPKQGSNGGDNRSTDRRK